MYVYIHVIPRDQKKTRKQAVRVELVRDGGVWK